MEFAYSLNMYSPPVRVRPANARKSSSTNINAAYTFVYGANKQHSHHHHHQHQQNQQNHQHNQDQPPDKNTEITVEEDEDIEKNQFEEEDINYNINDHNNPSNSNDEEDQDQDHRHHHHQYHQFLHHQPDNKKIKKNKSSDTRSLRSIRSRIPGRRRPPPAGTIPQSLAHRPVSHHSHSRTSSSLSACSRASHETQGQGQTQGQAAAQVQAQAHTYIQIQAQAQAQAEAQVQIQAQLQAQQQVNLTSTHAATDGTLVDSLGPSPPASTSKSSPNNGTSANAPIASFSPTINNSSSNNTNTDANTREYSTSASAPPLAGTGTVSLASSSNVPTSPSSVSTTAPASPVSTSKRRPSSPKSFPFILPIFSTDSAYHIHHHTIGLSTTQNRLQKRDSIHYQSSTQPHTPQQPPTPTSPIKTLAGLSSSVRRRSSRGKHHDAMPTEPSHHNSPQRHPSITTTTPTKSNSTVIMASNENLAPSSAEGSITPSSNSNSTKPSSIPTKPFINRHNRIYIHEPTLLYPLPVDLAELHRQSLRTLMLFQLFGGPTTAPEFSNKPPSRVLEVGCGSAFWSMMCHRYFAQHGHSSISFTGLDIVPLVGTGLDQNWKPDKDMRWRFVQHDMRRTPWPLADNEFDLIMVKDMSLSNSMRDPQQFFEEYLRLLKPGGVLEFWESDHTIRMLRPHILKKSAVMKPDSDSDSDDSSEEEDSTEKLGAYIMTNNTPLSAPLNPFLVEYNGWATKALDARGLSAVPCTLIGPHLLQEADTLMDVRSKRLAVPLSEIRWEREGVGGVVTKDGKSYIDSMKGKGRMDSRNDKPRGKSLTTSQAALRRTALETVVGMILCLEPILREVSGKSQDEWDGWTGKMMNDLLREGGTSWGECLEVGAWCARKKLNTVV